MQIELETNYHVKGMWSQEGIFNGSLYKNNKKFSTCVRVQLDRISFTKNTNKDQEHRDFRDWLKSEKLSSFKFLTDQIELYIEENPTRKVRLI